MNFYLPDSFLALVPLINLLVMLLLLIRQAIIDRRLAALLKLQRMAVTNQAQFVPVVGATVSIHKMVRALVDERLGPGHASVYSSSAPTELSAGVDPA